MNDITTLDLPALQGISPEMQQLIKGVLNRNHEILNLKSYQSKRIIKKKISDFLKNPEQLILFRQPVQIDRYHHISVQASSEHYSFPRDNLGSYTHVEIAYPSFRLSRRFVKEHGFSGEPLCYLPLSDLYRELAGLMHKFKQLKLGKIASMDKPKRKPKKA